MANTTAVSDPSLHSEPLAARSASLSRPGFVLLVALAVGFLAAAFLYGQAFGFGYLLAALVVLAGWILLARGNGPHASRSAFFLLACFLALGIFVAVRASVALRVFDVLFGLAVLVLAGVVYLPGGLPKLSVAEYAVHLTLGSLAAAVQPFLFLGVDLPRVRAIPRGNRTRLGTAVPVLWGILLALPLLLLFGGLLAAADPIYGSYLRQLFDWNIDLSELFARLAFSLILAWLALGLARYAFLARPGWELPLARPASAVLGTVQAITVLALLDALFVGFVAVQAAYLFGGLDTMARSGITHSEYARRGFFELMCVAALVVTMVLVLDWWTAAPDRPVPRGRRLVDYLHAVLVLCTLVVLASAVYRMQLYIAQYTLTELRFYTTVLMGWLAVVLLMLLAVLLRSGTNPPGRAFDRRRFAFATLVSGMIIWLGVNLANPDAIIANANLRRFRGITRPLVACQYAKGVPAGDCLDVPYLASLSPDAVPAVVTGVDLIDDPCARAALARALREEEGQLADLARTHDWRGATLGELRARQVLGIARPALDGVVAACPGG
jgi:hypothetical protein